MAGKVIPSSAVIPPRAIFSPAILEQMERDREAACFLAGAIAAWSLDQNKLGQIRELAATLYDMPRLIDRLKERYSEGSPPLLAEVPFLYPCHKGIAARLLCNMLLAADLNHIPAEDVEAIRRVMLPVNFAFD